MRYGSQAHFATVPSAQIERSQFDRSHGYKTTFNAGLLIPIFCDFALPGDTFNVSLTAFARLATPIKPIMDNLYMDTQFFAVPYRLLWDNFQKFMGEQTNPGDSTDYLIPQTTSAIAQEGSIEDYFGLPITVGGYSYSALPARAYALCWNEWYRDENLQDALIISKGDGPDLPFGTPMRRGKRPDYFNSCLPFPQKGPSVLLPLGSTAPVLRDDSVYGGRPEFINSGGSIRGGLKTGGANEEAPVNVDSPTGGPWPTGTALLWGATGLMTDLSAASAASINELRQAFQVQRLYERDARGGTRYTEIVRAHFKVVSPDARLQRPEYLGGGSTPIVISPIAQTSGTPEDLATGYTPTPQGNLSAIGTANIRGHGFVKSFTEHCIVLGLLSVRADYTYQNGLDRLWSHKTRLEHFWPVLAHLGEQAVLNKEIFMTGVASADDGVFGYQERYAEYRYKPSRITGKFRSTDPQSLDFWHLGIEFADTPALDDVFIQENPPIDRIVAVPSEPHFIFDGWFSFKAARPMPVYGVPGLIDHF